MDYESELNLSFEELEDEEIGENLNKLKHNNIRSEQVLLEWKSKMDISNIRISSSTRFPIKIFHSNYFIQSFENFDYENSRARIFQVIFFQITNLVVKQWRLKLQQKYILLYQKYKPSEGVLECLPFIIGYAIRIAIEDKVRYGEKILTLHNGLKEIYQLMFKEITGLSIGQIYIEKHLSKYSKRDYFEMNKPSKEVVEFMKAKGDIKEFMRKGMTIQFQSYLKSSKIQRDQFEHELSVVLSTKQFQKAKKKTDELRYPPMDFYEKFLNQNIIENLNNDDEIENQSMSRLSKSIFGERSKSTFVKTQINISRVSPMLRSVIQTDSYVPRQVVLSFRDRKMLEKSDSSVIISDKSNHEELPEIRAKEVTKMIEQNKRSRSRNKSSTPVRDRVDEFLEDRRTSIFMLPIQKIVPSRKRFIKLGEGIDHEGNVLKPQLKSVENVKNILNQLPPFDTQVKFDKLPSFPVNVRNQTMIMQEQEEVDKKRIVIQGTLGKIPLNYPSPQFSKSYDKITEDHIHRKQEQESSKKKLKKYQNKSFINAEFLIQKDQGIEDNYKTPNFSEDQGNQDKVQKAGSQQIRKMATLDYSNLTEMEEEKHNQEQKSKQIHESLDPIYQRQRELRKKMMHKNNIFFNRQIMIEKNLIDKSQGKYGQNYSRLIETQFDRTLEKYMHPEDLGLWHKEDIEDIEQKIKNFK
ncbi:UNKNOWN [Stylonychia lemnae]|uniref:Uncharacterized protein n=1 Tax=Stylonychia lemnae TaxID=5949 RepID=A0A078A9E7_STYLE|nr:UNKNOWN [Stylonychia lemnae]|eukprot:CDW77413.1 UNKNOWN [Stylonychia lemnae]